MVRVEMAKWNQTLEDLRRASLHAPHARSRERFQALYLIASGRLQRHHLRRPHRPAGRDRPRLGASLQRARPGRPELPPHRRALPPFTPRQAQQLVDVVETTDPSSHGLPGHNWTVKKLKEWVFRTFGRVASRNGLRRVLRGAGLTWKKVKKLLGKAKPEKRAAHIQQLLRLFAGVCDGEVVLIYVDEVHVHRDLDHGYTWGRSGRRICGGAVTVPSCQTG